ncbi:hypothetical protein [Streptomyces sp. NPDC002547]
MAANVVMPVFVRVGDGGDVRWGEITVGLTDGALNESEFRKQMADFLRGAADVLENTSQTDDGEVPDAAAHG